MSKHSEFNEHHAWGLSTSLDLHNCDPELVENKDKIKEYLITLCDKVINIERYGEPIIYRFGKKEDGVEGYTAIQLVVTSDVACHFGVDLNGKGYAYIDIFSCAPYDPEKATKFTAEFFRAKSYNKNVLYRKHWFEEKEEVTRGRGLRIEIKEKLYDHQSKFQHIQVFETKAFGRMLVLDDCVMLTDYDEFAYHEMIAHVPINSHPNPKKVLVIGGGDGGVVRELVKHPEIEEIYEAEIDSEVVDVSKKYFPNISSGYNDPRVKVFYQPGEDFIKEHNGFDIIIVDSPDPIGPAKELFTEKFYKNIKSALNDDGILVTQSESMFYFQKLIANLSKFIPKIFPLYKHYYTLVPTYPSGTIGFSFCSKKYGPIKNFDRKRAEEVSKKGLKYYNPDLHIASFSLPTFIKKKVYG